MFYSMEQYVEFEEERTALPYGGYGNAMAQEAAWYHAQGQSCPFDCSACDADDYRDHDYREPLEDAPAADWDRFAAELWEDSQYVQQRDADREAEVARFAAEDPWTDQSAPWEPPF